MGQLSRSEGNVVGKGIRSIVGVKALTVRIVSFQIRDLLRDGTVVDESLHGALLPTIEEVDMPILIVSVALAICTLASVAQLVLVVSALVIENTNEKLQLWKSYREITGARTGNFAIGRVPHVIHVVV